MEARQEVQAQEQEPKARPKVAIIVLNWNGWRDTIECLESLQRITYPNYQVIVVDNGSTDSSVEKINEWVEGKISIESKYFRCNLDKKPIKLIKYDRTTAEKGDDKRDEEINNLSSSRKIVIIQTGENLGFSRGNNIGIRYALREKFDYLLVLNNDTVVKSDFLDILINFALENFNIALIGPRILDYQDGSNWQFPVKNPLTFFTLLIAFTPLGRLLRYSSLYKNCFYREDLPHQVYAVPGSCMLFKRETLERIGLFDEKMFLYWEEFVMAEKLRRHRLKTYIQPASIIYHKLGKSTKKLKALRYIANIETEKYFFANYFLLDGPQRLIMKLLRIFGYFIRMLGSFDYIRKFGKFVKAIRGY